MSFNAEVYSDLAVRAEQRVHLIDYAIKEVQRNGYSKHIEFAAKRLSVGGAETGQMIGDMFSSVAAMTKGNTEEKRKSPRTRAPPAAGASNDTLD